jgi:hypothetical protein
MLRSVLLFHRKLGAVAESIYQGMFSFDTTLPSDNIVAIRISDVKYSKFASIC